MLRPKTRGCMVRGIPDSDNADVGIRDILYVYAIISAPLCADWQKAAFLFSPFSLLRILNGRSLK